MFGLFKSDPVAKLQKTIKKKYEEAANLQRNGKIAEYADAMEEINGLEEELNQLSAQAS